MKTRLSYQLTRVTPSMAKKLLATLDVKSNRTLTQRRLNVAHRDHLANQITQGHWVMNGESIKISVSGYLIDGQHRCAAIIQANKAIETLVIKNLPDETIDTIDQNKMRTAKDVLVMSGVAPTLAMHLSVAVKMEMQFLKNTSPYYSTAAAKFTPREIREFSQENPDIERAQVEVLNWSHGETTILPHGALAFLLYNFRLQDFDKANTWMYELITGSNILSGDARLYLRNKSFKEQRMKTYTDKTVKLSWYVKAWYLYKNNKTITQQNLFKVTPNSEYKKLFADRERLVNEA